MNMRRHDGPVVLGGGVAGIAAAVSLARNGLRPLLLESRPYIGGRARSFVHEPSGDVIDNGQHLMMGCYHRTFELLELLGTRSAVQLQRSLAVEFRDPDGSSDRLAAPATLPSPADVLVGMMRLKRITAAERLALLRIGIALALGTPGSDETAATYLRRHGQTANLRRRLWDPIIIATLNLPAERASALLFARVMRLAFLGKGTDSHLAFPTRGLSELFQPATSLTEHSGGSVSIGTAITAVERHDEGYVIRLKDREPILARQVISALPERALRAVLRQPELVSDVLGATPAFEYSPIVSLYLWYNHNPASLPAFAAMIGTAVQWMFNRRAIDGSRNEKWPGLVSCTISAAVAESSTDADSIVARADAELQAAFPELAGAGLLGSLVLKERHATFAATPEAERARPMAQTAASGFFLAGDWTSTGLPATIEGAAQSGFTAAAALMNAGDRGAG